MSDSQLHLDLGNCFEDRIGPAHGLGIASLHDKADELNVFTHRLGEMESAGDIRWRRLCADPLRTEHLNAVKQAADEVNAYFQANAKGKRCKHLIVLGIGGSALGNIALQAALKEHVHNLTPCTHRVGARMYVLDNVDPQLVGDLMRHLEIKDPGLQHTCVNVISKSGETAETAAQFLIFRDWLERHLGEAHTNHIVAITDPDGGTMRSIVDAQGYRSLPVPDGVGGRFSVLSPVGLFSAAMCGIAIDELLAGAAAMDDRCRQLDPFENPAAALAHVLIAYTQAGKSQHVLMPYCNGLYSLADWYRQLWAESLGKKTDLDGREVFAGATPIKALGTTDQHSQVQLYREGPNDKVIGFVDVARWEHDVTIPQSLEVEALSYLPGKTLGELLNAEKRATEFALVESERPNYTITLPSVSAYHVGEFLQLWMVATAYAGLMLNINAYDQPAVETGKVATFGLMGRNGYEQWKQEVESRLGRAMIREML